MRYFPMFLDMAGKNVALAGGGEQVAQKARLLARTEARLTVMAVDANDELCALVASGRAGRSAHDVDHATLAAADFAFVATGDDRRDAAIARLARAGGALVNVIDAPDACDMITPALVDRDPVVVAIGSEGAAPVLAKEIRGRVEALLAPDIGALAAMLAERRGAAAAAFDDAARLEFWTWATGGAPRDAWSAGRRAEAAALVDDAIRSGATPDRKPGQGSGRLVFVTAPPAADLLTLRAMRRLQEADAIFHSAGVDPAMLELARRDASRAALADDLSGDRSCAEVAAAAKAGLAVVILNPGAAPGLIPDETL